MTQAPIEPRHKDEAAKAAEYEDWISVEVSNHPVAIAARASILAHAQTLANLEAAQADLAEIDRIAVAGGFAQCLPGDPCLEIAAIAAPYRAIDPVAEALKAEAMTIVLAESVPRTIQQIEAIRNGIAGQGKIDLVMRALKRGMELARTIEGDR
jgi:hypothetical protein